MIKSCFKTLAFAAIFVIPCLTLIGLIYQGIWFWLSPLFAFLVLPLFDKIVGDELIEFKEPEQPAITLGRVLTSLFVPIQLGLLAFGIHQVNVSEWQTLDWILAVFTMGLATGGMGITVSHELVHRTEAPLRWLGGLCLSSVCYGQFMVEHVHGHHTWIGTPHDPATSRKNESVYAFLPRSIFGGFLSSLKFEKERLQKRKLPVYQNRIYLTSLTSLSMLLLCYLGAGWKGAIFFLAQSVVAIILLEIINYVEHYGLLRQRNSTGTYEPIALSHSWDSRRILSNWFLINLQRHSDHHKYPTRDFTRLRFHNEAPTLPAGYPEMLILALIPPLWFHIMNKRIP